MLIFPSILGVFWYFIILQKWIQSERVVDPVDSSAHMSNKEEAQSIPLTTITANGSGVDMGAGTDSLSVEEMNATADENRESETRIQLEDGAIVMSNKIIQVNEYGMTCVRIGLKLTDGQATVQGARCGEF